jgi:hypothetical protein
MTLDLAKLEQKKAELEQQLSVTQTNVIRLQGAIGYVNTLIKEMKEEEKPPEPKQE